MKKLFILIILIVCLENIKASDTLDIKKWKEYYIKEANLKFYYPDFILSLDSAQHQLFLFHGIKIKHPNLCNHPESMDSISSLVDLSFSIRYLKENYKEFFQSMLGEKRMKNYFTDDSLKTEKGFIEKVTAGKRLNGYKLEEGAEGCGMCLYVFPLNDKSTLLISMPYSPDNNIGFFNQNIYYNHALIKGLMSPEMSQKIFNKILESIQ